MSTPRENAETHRDAMESALLNTAIILYARATTTTSDERKGFDLRPRFTDDQRIVHQELMDLRNNAIAHFGSGGSYRGVWQSEVVILQPRGDGGARAGVVTRRQTMDKKLVQRARGQITVTHDLLAKIGIEKLGEVTTMLNKEVAADPQLAQLAHQYPLSLDAFLASSDAANEARSAVNKGFARGTVQHD